MKFNFIFNKKKYELKKKADLTLIQISELLGLVIPRFCYHNSLSIAGNCRMCLIEVNTSLKPIVSCGFSLINNLKINTNTKKISIMRESILEFLLINHPLDCPICDSAGECDLQDISLLFGNDLSRFKENKRAVSDKNFGDFIKTIMTRCIHCTRCIRFIDEYMFNDNGHIGTLGRGVNTIVSNYFNHSFEHDLSGNLADLCPVGALTHKTYAFTARPWELTSVEYFDFIDVIPMNIRIDLKGNDIYRIIPIYTQYMQDEFISNRTRYFYDVTFEEIKANTPIKIEKNFITKQTRETSWNKTINKDLMNKEQIKYHSDDIYTSHLLNYFSILSDFKNNFSNSNNNLRKSFINQKDILKTIKTTITNATEIKKKSTMLALKLEKSKIVINTIGKKIKDFTHNIQIGITNNVLDKMSNAKLKTTKTITNFFFNTITSKRKKKEDYINIHLIDNIGTIIGKEIGKCGTCLHNNKRIASNNDRMISFNLKHSLVSNIQNNILCTPFFKPFFDFQKNNKNNNSSLIIPTLNNLNQNISFWSLFGEIKKNPQISKSKGFDDYTLTKHLINYNMDNLNSLYNKLLHHQKLIEKLIVIITNISLSCLNIKKKNSLFYIKNNIIDKNIINNLIQFNIYNFYSKYLQNSYIHKKKKQQQLNILYTQWHNFIFIITNAIEFMILTEINNFYDYKKEKQYN